MPRQVRREFAGAICHVMNRGDRRENLFRDEPRGLSPSGAAEKNTPLRLKWIAEDLKMNSWTHVSNLVAAKRKTETLSNEN